MTDSPAPAWTAHSPRLETTLALGAAVGEAARAGDLIALVGELGAGKTQFVRGLSRGLGATDAPVSSPTFVMVQEYAGGAGRPALVHLDAYRLNSLDDLESIGWDVAGPAIGGEWREHAVVAVEWADRLDALLGEDHLLVNLAHADGGGRDVSITPHGSWLPRWDSLVEELNHVITVSAKPSVTQPHNKCPICGKPTHESNAAFPFCSPRCRTIDLGNWVDETYRISRPIEQSDLDEE